VTHVRPVLGQRGVGLLPDLLPVQLRRAAVVLGGGVAGGAAVLPEEHRLPNRRSSRRLADRGMSRPQRAAQPWKRARAKNTYRVGVASNLHAAQLKPVPVGVQLSGPEAERQGGREVDRQRGRDKEAQRQRHRDREVERQRDKEAERQRGRDKEAERQRGREVERQRGRETKRQRDNEAERQRDNEAERSAPVSQRICSDLFEQQESDHLHLDTE